MKGESQKIVFLPITVQKCYSDYSNEDKAINNFKLFGEFESSLSLDKKLFNRSVINLEFKKSNEQNVYKEIFTKLVALLGDPIYFSNELIQVWKIENVYVSFGTIDVLPYDYKIVMRISYIKPSVLYTYEEFLNDTKVLMELPNKWNLTVDSDPSLFAKGKSVASYSTPNYQYTIILNKKTVQFLCSKKIVINKNPCIEPEAAHKEDFKNESELRNVIDNVFIKMLKRDSTLEKR